jgi:SNF2 family DNA or RNA helicase
MDAGGVLNDTVVLNANWTGGRLVLWAESGLRWSAREPAPEHAHPFALDAERVADALAGFDVTAGERVEITLRLPAADGNVMPSPRLAHAIGQDAATTGALELVGRRVQGVAIRPEQIGPTLDRLADHDPRRTIGACEVHVGRTVEFYGVALRLARHLLAQQRFVASLRYDDAGPAGLWQAWLGDEPTGERVAALVGGAPAAAFACADEFEHDMVTILEDFLSRVVDAECRRALVRDEMEETIESIEPELDEHVGWLTGLLGAGDRVRAARPGELVRGVRRWIARLEDRGASTAWRLLLCLEEPGDEEVLARLDRAEVADPTWRLSFHLQSMDASDIVVQGEDIWLLSGEIANIEGRMLERPHELFLAELGRAARLFPALERSLTEAEPVCLELSTSEAYRFLREARPVLQEQGIGVRAPAWWDSPAARVAAKLRVIAPPIEELMLGDSAPGATSSAATLGLAALVDFDWEITLGGATLTLGEFEALATRRAPLIRINGRWVEVRPEDVRSAVEFMRSNPSGKMPLTQAIRIAYASDERETGIPVVGLEASGWVEDLLNASMHAERLPLLDQPKGLVGTLRPYQRRGLSWLSFLERFGLGPCLADDMGLGKTIQVLALLLHEREVIVGAVAPTLVVVPMSVVGNWMREAKKFAPSLRVVVHHGPERDQGAAFERALDGADLVITTYALAHRDRPTIERVAWRRVVLDEAQFVKNPRAKQSIAVRSLAAERRVALTGTPVENRLSELWSIMEFLNPSYLGGVGSFSKRFAIPIERYHDEHRSRQLRELIQPFVLRRLKTDPTVLSELPEKFESREFAHLTPEQADLYETYVKRMLGQIEQVEGMRRRGLVLATLVRLKQICNHPSQVLKDVDPNDALPPDPSRSGKCVRLLSILDEVMAEGDQALVFTQFRQMGLLLASMLRHELDREVLVLHGGLTKTQREVVVDRFQTEGKKVPILVASLKAGGIGLNLTAATHVIHFDRWWNPAVENQATDRAYRIGQTRAVQVHKFVVRGTLEERIDQMIEEKTGLAERIVGSGERWLTELDTSQLRSLLTLRSDAVDDSEDDDE